MRGLLLLCGMVLLPSLDLKELEGKLRDKDPYVRKDAVEGLAKLGTEEGWSLVFDALKDPEPQVADEAQLALGQTSDEQVVLELQGKRGLGAKAEAIQGRALEALGRSPLVIPAEVFVKPLTAKDAELRFRAAWSVERLARAGKLGVDEKGKLKRALEKVQAKDKSGNVQAEAFSALVAAYRPDSMGRIEQALMSKDVPLLVAALQAAGEFKDQQAVVSFAMRARANADRSVRLAAANLLAQIGNKVTMTLLVEQLEAEEDLRLSWRIVDHLQALSGLKHGRDARPWKAWAGGLPIDWQPGNLSRERDYGSATASFVGMPVLSENLTLLVDFSGSTWQEREGGVTRKSKLDEEVRRVLEALPETTWFNLIPYATDPIPWEKELVPASKRNVKKALEFFENCKTQGKGNFLSAALLALEDPRVDTIMVLTDGAPTGGERWNLLLIVPWLAEQNRYRSVAIDSILVDAKGWLANQWVKLGELTGGRSVVVDLK